MTCLCAHARAGAGAGAGARAGARAGASAPARFSWGEGDEPGPQEGKAQHRPALRMIKALAVFLFPLAVGRVRASRPGAGAVAVTSEPFSKGEPCHAGGPLAHQCRPLCLVLEGAWIFLNLPALGF